MTTLTSRAGLTTLATVGIVLAALVAGGLIYRFGFSAGRSAQPDAVIIDDRGTDAGNVTDRPDGFDDKGGDRGGRGMDDIGPDDRGGDRR